jgi:hypothetical protein
MDDVAFWIEFHFNSVLLVFVLPAIISTCAAIPPDLTPRTSVSLAISMNARGVVSQFYIRHGRDFRSNKR